MLGEHRDGVHLRQAAAGARVLLQGPLVAAAGLDQRVERVLGGVAGGLQRMGELTTNKQMTSE